MKIEKEHTTFNYENRCVVAIEFSRINGSLFISSVADVDVVTREKIPHKLLEEALTAALEWKLNKDRENRTIN